MDNGNTGRAMEDARAEACAACERCVIAAPAAAGAVPYEIHVTVAEADVDGFGHACAALGVKPLFLALQLAAGGTVRDVMTSSVHFGDDATAGREALRISGGLGLAGYDVIRTKIETVPWHPDAPSASNGRVSGPGQYFEAHLAVTCAIGDRERLSGIARELGLHLSRNVLKDRGDGTGVVMATDRSGETTYEAFRSRAEACRETIRAAGYPVDKLIVEYAIFDSRETQDAAWLGKR